MRVAGLILILALGVSAQLVRVVVGRPHPVVGGSASAVADFAGCTFGNSLETDYPADWEDVDGYMRCASANIRGSTGGTTIDADIWIADTFAADQVAEVVIATITAGQYTGPLVRGNSDPDYYACLVDNNELMIYEVTASVQTQLGATETVNVEIGHVIQLGVSGTTLTCKVFDGLTEENSFDRTDSTHATGQPGVASMGSNARLDDWAAEDQ